MNIRPADSMFTFNLGLLPGIRSQDKEEIRNVTNVKKYKKDEVVMVDASHSGVAISIRLSPTIDHEVSRLQAFHRGVRSSGRPCGGKVNL